MRINARVKRVAKIKKNSVIVLYQLKIGIK